MSDEIPFPGPDTLGRGLVITPDDDVPEPARDWPLLVIDDEALVDAEATATKLRGWWMDRTASVVVLAVPFAELRAPETTGVTPYDLTPAFTFHREAIHFHVWANRYDARNGALRWHHTDKALTLGAGPGTRSDVKVDEVDYWIDGGPRTPIPELPLIHVNQVWGGSLLPDRDDGWGSLTDHDDSQRTAVYHPGGPARIIAPAGSGKTRVLTARLRHLVTDRGWDPGGIMAVAYNVRAAEEMKQRTRDTTGVSISTLHSLGYRILGDARGRRPPVIEEREIRSILTDLVPGRPRAGEDMLAPYIEALADVRDGLQAPEEVEDLRDDVPGFEDVFQRYRSVLTEKGVIDHPEQIYAAVECLLTDGELRRRYQHLARHVLVDEFQDLTPARLLMIRLIAGPQADVYGVGDDDQVIYGHAGADPGFLIRYVDYFPGATPYELSTNYRCPPDVTSAASTLLTHNRMRIPKNTLTGRPDANEGLKVVTSPSERLGDNLVDTVQALMTDGFDPEQIAVLSRVNVGLLAPQILLTEEGVPVQKVVGPELLDRSGVQAVMAWLRLGWAAASDNRLGGGDLGLAMRRPPRRISRGLRRALTGSSWDLSRLARFASENDNDRLRERMEELVDDIEVMGRRVSNTSTKDVLLTLRDEVGLGSALDRLDRSKGSNPTSHGDDLAALIQISHLQPDATIFEEWLRGHLRRPASREGITLSTVHRVKGLEWPAVVVWDVSGDMFPHRLSAGRAEKEEERRVFHVAITRGMEKVVVLGTDKPASPYRREMATEAQPEPERGVGPPVHEARRDGIEAVPGRNLSWSGFKVKVVRIDDKGARVKQPTGTTILIPWGERVEWRGRGGPLQPPPTQPVESAPDGAVLEGLREWRLRRATTDGVPPYVVAHDRHLESIARARPTSLDALAECDGIGPSRLERYGEEILDVIED